MLDVLGWWIAFVVSVFFGYYSWLGWKEARQSRSVVDEFRTAFWRMLRESRTEAEAFDELEHFIKDTTDFSSSQTGWVKDAVTARQAKHRELRTNLLEGIVAVNKPVTPEKIAQWLERGSLDNSDAAELTTMLPD